LSISQCPSWYSDIGLAIPAAFCGGGIGIEALLGLLAARKADFDWLLVLTMDLLSLACSVAAIVVSGTQTYSLNADSCIYELTW
jgi:hypothetical protein